MTRTDLVVITSRGAVGLATVTVLYRGSVSDQFRAGREVRETTVQRVILEHFAENRLVTDHPPIVGVGPHSGNPHFAPAEGPGTQSLQDLIPQRLIVALGLANLANVFDPEVFVLGGGMVEAGDVLLEPVRGAFADMVLAGSDRPPVARRTTSTSERSIVGGTQAMPIPSTK